VLREIIAQKTEKIPTYQVMLLCNDAGKQVEVHEERDVNFSRIQEHLQHGGSVFITSRSSQKIPAVTISQKRAQRRRALRTVTAFYFDHV
jgi:hypothetical protein